MRWDVQVGEDLVGDVSLCFEHWPFVDGGPVGQEPSDDHDCQSALTEPLATGILGGEAMKHPLESRILEMTAAGLPVSKIAAYVGCSRRTVTRIVRRAQASWSDDEQGCVVEQDRAQDHCQEVENDLG